MSPKPAEITIGLVPAFRFNLIAGTMILVFALLFAGYGYYDYLTTLHYGEKAAEQIAENTALITEGTLESSRQLLHAMEFLSQPSSPVNAITESLVSLKAQNPHIMDLLIISPEGSIRYWTGNGAPPDIRDRDYFTYHLNRQDGSLYVGPPLLSKVHQGQWFFAISQATSDEFGSVRFVLVAIIDVAMLHDKMSNRLALPGSTQALLSDSGQIYARLPDQATHVGKSIVLDPVVNRLDGERTLVSVIKESQIDHKRRVIAFRRLQQYPMIAAGSIMTDELLADWRWRLYLMVLLWTLIAGAIVWTTIRANSISRLQMSLATTDSLTGMHNRRALLSAASRLQRSQKFAGSLSLLMIDIDYFKSINDRFGHLIGDQVIRQVSATIKNQIRSTDILGRYGGEEFLVLMPDTGFDGAMRVAENLRIAIAGQITEPEPISVSIGVATTSEHDSSLEEALIRADQGLYAAKAAGRNCVKAL